MNSKHILTLFLASALATGQVSRAAADAGDLMGGIVGGLITGAIINGAQNKRTPKRKVVRPSVSSATRATNRETQTALNYFGFPAGTADGVLGRKSRAAISGYQAYVGFPVTGQLTQFERDLLVGAYQRGITGSYETVQLVSKDPDGSKALLIAQRDFMTGGSTPRRTTGYAGMPIEVSEAIDEIAESSDPSAEQLLQRSGFIQLADLNGDGNNDYILDTSFSGSSFWCSSVQCKTIVFASTSDGYRRNDLLAFDPTPASFDCFGGSCRVDDSAGDTTVMTKTEPPASDNDTVLVEAAPDAELAPLPVFGAPSGKPSLSSHCSKVSILTNANGGFSTVSTASSNPDLAINELFCVARAYALDKGEQVAANLHGITQAQIDAQCAQYGAALKDHVAALSLKAQADVVRDVGGFVLSSGIDPAQLTTTAQVCLASGYRTDKLDVALGSALLLYVLGQKPYGELMGHHLSQGFGATSRADLAMEWYRAGLDALDNGAAAVFAPSQTERTQLLNAAVFQMDDEKAEIAPEVPTRQNAKLPTFVVSE